ncbi:MAG TPA: AAA family ATPase [Verrucomicrobiae bacterium]|nr:AAA family ATPase [Verrucomicrobiae bacterium]
MSEQVDIAVDLGAAAPALPEILTLEQLCTVATPPPPLIIEGILHQGCKMILGGTSKSNKSWCLLDLALAVASGQPWWGRACAKLPVVYINFELHTWAVAQRINALCGARPECKAMGKTLHVWNLRGHNADLTLLRPKLEEQLMRHPFGLIILDPAYKVLGNRDENANGEIAGLMNELEGLAQRTGAAVVVAHHFAKGDSTTKSAMDRMSGAGAWSRDPDSIVVLTPHEEENCFTVTSILRNLPQLPEFVVAWEFPLMRVAKDLNPDALRRTQSKNKVCSDREFIDTVLGAESLSYKRVIGQAREQLEMSEATANRYLNRLKAAGMIGHSGGLYWASHQEVAS